MNPASPALPDIIPEDLRAPYPRIRWVGSGDNRSDDEEFLPAPIAGGHFARERNGICWSPRHTAYPPVHNRPNRLQETTCISIYCLIVIPILIAVATPYRQRRFPRAPTVHLASSPTYCHHGSIPPGLRRQLQFGNAIHSENALFVAPSPQNTWMLDVSPALTSTIPTTAIIQTPEGWPTFSSASLIP
ncbi:hypothetical protein NMY22_g13024 [Coprinellus aureogranulatus]|nr:hypothetical protein NMY22_g13024 [Coprinellus aureogranulatus]